jgi:hypothetical protein
VIWSYSTYRQFNKCQRQWFFKNVYASHAANDPLRKEAYLLGQLKSISAWRGDVTDKTLSNFVVRGIAVGKTPKLDQAIDYARILCRRQYDFSTAKKYRSGQSKSSIGVEFCALFPIEYDIPISNQELTKAWNDIELALTNFFNNASLMDRLRSAKSLLAQRALSFQINGTYVRAVPDLIAFYENDPPRIFDWKVHSQGLKSSDQQLMTYAIALKRAKPHKDFPDSVANLQVEDVRISECQLLLNIVRDYELTRDLVIETEEEIAENIFEMNLSGAMAKSSDATANDFQTTRFPEMCTTCQFKKICWENFL